MRNQDNLKESYLEGTRELITYVPALVHGYRSSTVML